MIPASELFEMDYILQEGTNIYHYFTFYILKTLFT